MWDSDVVAIQAGRPATTRNFEDNKPSSFYNFPSAEMEEVEVEEEEVEGKYLYF
jgi:hypothetical protein